jgi:murein DD-endopeptidase MepM/ murein hydrolase activator NlpD
MAYVDHDRGPGVLDYACGGASYNAPPHDAHQGTDIALKDLGAMAAGVPVRAAAAGRVVGARDGMADVSVRAAPGGMNGGANGGVAGRECGNGVRIDHGQGWFTQYCHLRRGTVAVRAGASVPAGGALGLVGMSGASEHPHLHFQVEHRGRIVDPFAPHEGGPDCGPKAEPSHQSSAERSPGASAEPSPDITAERVREQLEAAAASALWTDEAAGAMPYRPSAIYNAGFAAGAPDIEAIRAGEDPGAALGADAPALVLWVDAFNVRAGDTLDLAIADPSGRAVFRHAASVPKDQMRRFVFAGLRAKKAQWPPGRYEGRARLVRADGTQVDAARALVVLR